LDWEKFSYVIASKRRKDIILILLKGPKTPKQISESTGIRLSHTSNLLSGLVQKQIVICLTPKRLKGRLYDLTDDGKKIGNYLSASMT